MDSRLKWMLLGVLVLLVLKYGVMGLTLWDQTFHPGRVEDPASPFLRPLLGLV